MKPQHRVLTTWLALMPIASLAAAESKSSESPADHLPPHIRRVTWFGERADWSHDGKRILFLSKTFGDAMEIDLANGGIRNRTAHYAHHGYTRALYLANGDILLSGPEQFDPKEPREARVQCRLFVLDQSGTKAAAALGTKCSEGPAVSRKRLHLAWTHVAGEYPDEMPAGSSRMQEADIVYEGGKPRLANPKLIIASQDLPFSCTMETQNYRPPNERELIFSAYGHQGTEVAGIDLATGKVVNYANAPRQYDEPEGIFPDGKHTLVECDKQNHRGSGCVDLWKLKLDGSGAYERLTHFSDYPGYKASNPVVSDDGRFIAFQLARSREAAGVGHGIFILDLEKTPVYHAQGEMAGEVTATSVILQSRLTASEGVQDGDVPGAAGVARFEWCDQDTFTGARKTGWLTAAEEADYIVRTRLTGLQAGTRYYYRLIFGRNQNEIQTGPTRTFRTLPGAQSDAEVSFVVVTGMNYDPFMTGRSNGGGKPSATELDKQRGYPALKVIRKLKPDFFVGTGDNVYYDNPRAQAAKTLPELRRKWQVQFALPRLVSLFAETAVFWEKDDHDFRYNDADHTGNGKPLPDLGIRTFLEQVPLIVSADPRPLTYRTHRVNRHLQLWFCEGRDYRSPNREPDGPGKTIWGREQREWLQRTLRASDATWRVLISPTPMVGPDDASKRDNHVNPRGFRQEGEAFFRWLRENQVGNFFVICGDRHWQYLSVHPSGYEEFSCGALCDENSRLGRLPGDEKSTDPQALIRQPYTQSEPSGGFLRVAIKPEPGADAAVLTCEFYDDTGRVLYSHTKRAGG